MKEQDKLRNTLREYYDTQQVPFSDDDWERASAYLNAERRKNRLRRPVIIFTVLLSALVIILFNSPKSTGNKKHPSSLLSDQKLRLAPASKPLVRSIGAATAQKVKVDSNANKGEKQSAEARVSVAETHPNISQADAIIGPAISLQTSEIKSDHNAQGGSGQEVPAGSLVNEAPAAPRADKPTQEQDKAFVKEVPQEPTDVLPPAPALAFNDPEKETAATDTVTLLPTLDAVLPAMVDTCRSVSITGTTTAAEVEAQDTLPEPASMDRLAGEGIFYEAGAAWFYGWKGPVNREARGFSPVIGINYMNRLSSRCALSFGVQYVRVSNLSNSSRTSRVSSYVYGEQSRVTVITPSTLHYLLVPLRFNYYRDQHNSFGAGVNLAYLLNVDATVTNYDERLGAKENYTTVKQGGYTEGFSWLDSQLAFFYRRRIGGALSLQTEIFLGLTDVKQDGFFGFSHKERNSGAKLSLIYYAFRKNGR